ncbi:MAG TPA: HEAT repeat domain-containing protein [Bryobacteraceae bacterium]|jgi:HEAT repeat protein|nr:HEAT repeat domain-containing protein [Bryobacteraceae bacterium]
MAVRIRVLCSLFLLTAVLLGFSGDKSTKQQIEEIKKLGKTDSQAIPELTKYLSDANLDIRAEAVRAIVKIGTDRSLDPLATATQDKDPQIEMLATDGIVNFYFPGYVSNGLLTHPLSRGEKQIKSLFSVRNRQEIPPEITVRPNIQDALAGEVAHGASVDARANAARAAGILHARAAVPALSDALRSRDTVLILESLYALQKIGDPAAGPAAGFLVRDLDEKVQLAALETVGVLRSVPSAPAVHSVLESARNDKVKRAALQAVALFGMPADRALFQQYANEKDVTMRAAAIEGLGRIREPEDTPVLDAAFNEKDADWRIHLAAAFALVNEGKVDTSEFSPLRFLVENLDQAGRGTTAQAYLTELCRRENVRKGVYTVIADASADQKVALCRILAASHAPDVVPVLEQLAKDPNSDVSLTATKSLGIAQGR